MYMDGIKLPSVFPIKSSGCLHFRGFSSGLHAPPERLKWCYLMFSAPYLSQNRMGTPALNNIDYYWLYRIQQVRVDWMFGLDLLKQQTQAFGALNFVSDFIEWMFLESHYHV